MIVKMWNNFVKLVLVPLLACGLLNAADVDTASQALLHSDNDGTLIFEAAADQNITFSLMGDAALLLNDVDLTSLLQRRSRVIAANTAMTLREPLSMDALKEQFRGVQRDQFRRGRRLGHLRNATRRNGISPRMLRRSMQRIQTVKNILNTLETNMRRDECRSSPCKNGGTCYDAYNAFQCLCAPGWQGVSCEEDVNECFDLASTDVSVCMNDAQCVNTPGSFRCLCRPGYSGAHCRLRQNTCLANQTTELCGRHGTCLPAKNAASYVCICDQGWTWADTNATSASPSSCIRDVDECAPEINPCFDECINLPGSFRCGACPPGYTGDGKYCHDLDECADGNNGGCSQLPKVMCLNTEGSYRCGLCPPGWEGDGRTCSESKSKSCYGQQICHPRAHCEYISETVVCSCPDGFYGHGYGADGCDEDSSRKPCDEHVCQNNGTCVISGRGTSCICQPGYTGAVCAEADACHPDPCQNGGTCRLQPDNQFQCTCPAGYTGSTCSHLRSYCGVVLHNATGSLWFPPRDGGSVHEYQPNERCALIIRTQRGMILNLTFGMFDLESSTDCSDDFLQLHDGSSLTARLIGRFCGHELPLGNGSIMSTQEQIFLWFRSDNATQGRGFNLTWRSQPSVCGTELTPNLQETGFIRSPGYPGKTRQGTDCRWKLTAPFGTRLQFRFYEINLGSPLQSQANPINCSNSDFLRLHDDDQLLYETCQSAHPDPIYSSSSLVDLHFHTDAYRADSSFQLHYEVVSGHPGCGGIFTEPKGLIIGYTQPEICLYLIRVPSMLKVQLEFQFINLKWGTSCIIQKLEIFDGPNEDGPLLGRYCGNPEASELQPLISSGNEVLLRYSNKFSGLSLGSRFEVRYTQVCSFNYTSSSSLEGFIETPKYPIPYYENVECTFNLCGPPNTLASISILDLALSQADLLSSTGNRDETESSTTNQTSYLDIYLSHNAEPRRITKNVTSPLELISETNQMRLVFHGGSNTQNARGLRAFYKFRSAPGTCGGVFTSPSGDFHKAFVEKCQLIVEAPGRKHIRLSIMTSAGAHVSIYDNSTGVSAKLLVNEDVGNHLNYRFDESVDSNLLTIFLTSVTFSLTRLVYEPTTTNCGGDFKARYGTIKSPNWPNSYGANEDCTWIIRAPLGHTIELVVHNFTLERGWGECPDYLNIRNGDQSKSPLIGAYCQDIPSRIPSYGNVLYLHFHSDDSFEESGFFLNWEMSATGCGGKLSSPAGSIHSPHSIADNRGAVACDWQITVAQGSTIDLKLESRDNVCNGQLALFDGPNTRSPRLPMNCSEDSSEQKTIRLSSTGNRVLVRYVVSSESPDGLNFVLDYSMNCVVQLEEISGVIETPNFPDEYPVDTHCRWDIRSGGANNRIQLAFSHMSLEGSNEGYCLFDYASLRDYKDNELISEQRLCVDNNLVISTKGNRLVVEFGSDGSQGSQGFHAEYKRLACGGLLQGAFSGNIETPNAPYSVNMDCHWQIIAPAGHQIRLVLREVHIETPWRNCSQDLLTINSTDNVANSLWRSCSTETSEQTILSPANELNIYFHSSSQRARKYMKARYAIVPATCGGLINKRSLFFASPNYYEPGIDVFDKDVECVWEIDMENTYELILNVNNYNLTNSSDCESAKLQFSGIDKPYCGVGSITKRFGPNTNPILRFKVLKGSWGKFTATVAASCGGILDKSEGYIRSQQDSVCDWAIFGPEGSKISLNILQLECPRCATASQTNCTTGVRISNFDDDVVYHNLCEEHMVNLILPANRIRIETNGTVLSAKYSTISNSCGGSISSARGTLTSPNYPDSYPADVECVWTWEPLAGNAIELTFDAIDITKSDHCNGDFLELRAGIAGKLLGLYCDKVLPTESIVEQTKLWLKFRSVPGSSGNGFKLRWSYVHDIELTNLTSGTIVSPPTVTVRNDDTPYSWRIIGERDSHIVLDIKEYNTGVEVFDGFDESALPMVVDYSPSQLISSSNVIYLRTVNANFDAFRLNWRVESDAVLSGNVSLTNGDCGHEHTVGPMGRIEVKSPGYPHGYKDGLNCEWIFKSSDPAYHVYVNVLDARLEETNNCQIDYLSIESSSNLLDWEEQERFCNFTGQSPPGYAQLHGAPYLKLKFKTDLSLNGTGFRAEVRRACGANMTGAVGTINSSFLLEPQTSQVCTWHFEVRPGRLIDMQINYQEKVNNSRLSMYGLIWDGLDADAPLLGKFCSNCTTKFRTSGQHAMIRYFFPGILVARSNWTLTYREFRECDNEVRLTQQANSYVISTPGYPYYPHAHTDCTWMIIAPPGEVISANFVDNFDLSVRHCDQEFVELFDGTTTLSRRLLKTCRLPETTRSTGNLMLVHYQTDLSEPHTGFKLNVSISLCGGQYINRNGVITSENYPALGAYLTPAICEYTIKGTQNMHIEVSVQDLHLPFNPHSNDPLLDRIEFIDLQQQRSLLQVLFGNITVFPHTMTFQTMELGVRFVARNISAHSFRGFKMEYKSVTGSCYRDVTAAYGELHINSENIRGSFARRCRWRITVPKGQRVRFELLNLPDMASAVSSVVEQRPSRYDYILRARSNFELYNDADQLSKIADLSVVGYNGTNVFESTDNFMLIHIWVMPRFSNVAIRSRFTSTEASPCPPDIDNQAFGTVTSLELIGLPLYYCRVRFKAQPEETIAFELQELPDTMTGKVIIEDDVHYSETHLTQLTGTMFSLATTAGHLGILKQKKDGTMNVRLAYRRYPCGGYQRASEGTTIEMPQRPEHLGVIECVWMLDDSRDYMLDGNASLSDSCDREYLIITNHDNRRELAKICRGTNTLNTILLEARRIKITYHAAAYQAGSSQFLLRTSAQLSTSGLNKIIFVNYRASVPVTVDKASYRNNMELSWQFQSRHSETLRLEFQDRFFIEQSPNCSFDRLEVQSRTKSGLWQTVATFCGRDLPQPVWIQSGEMRVIFRTNGNITGDGFTFVVHPSCDIQLQATSELQSVNMNHPSRYNTAKCNIVITSNSTEQIVVSVKGKWRSLICRYNGFQTYRQEAGQEKQVDTNICPDFEIIGVGRIRIVHSTNFRATFYLEYQLIGCGGNYTAPFTLRQPPTLDEEERRNCAWHVLAPPQHAIFVVFKYLNLFQTPGCEFESVSVYRGNGHSDEQRVSRLCGNRTEPFSIMIDSNEAFIETNMMSHLRGFGDFMAKVEFTPNCNEHLLLGEGNSRMSIVRDYQLNGTEQELHCYFRASAPPGYRLSIWLKQLQLRNVTVRCANCSSLQLIDGFEEDSPKLGTFYSIVGNGSKRFSSTEDLLIQLSVTRGASQTVKFELILEMVTTVCGQLEYNLKDNQTARIQLDSANVSNSYEGNIHCTWHFSSARDMEVEVHSASLQDVSARTGKCIDYLLIEYSFLPPQKYCGVFNNTRITVPSSSGFNMIFHTAPQETTYSLNISVRVKSNCNYTYNSLDGVIEISDYLQEESFECYTDIRLPEGYLIVMEFDLLQLHSDSYFKVIALNANKSVIFNTTDEYFTPSPISSYRNELRFVYRGLKYLKVFYHSNIDTLPIGCGGELRSLSGMFSSPDYNDRNYSDCTWQLRVPSGVRLSINFRDFNMGPDSNCVLDNVKFYEVMPDNTQLLRHTFCGLKMPASFYMTVSRLKIVAKKSPNFDGTGFQLHYEPMYYESNVGLLL